MKKYLRLPNTTDRSLKAWNAADEYILRYIEEKAYLLNKTAIFHDRFGYLTCNLAEHHPITITYLESQKQSIFSNATANTIAVDKLLVLSILDDLSEDINIAIIKIPKSLDLFRLYLIKVAESLATDGLVISGFMTRHFTKAMLDIASEYFEEVEQSKAWKKSRLLILSKPKKNLSTRLERLKVISFNHFEYQQYLGVFSANHIDYATQFLLEHLKVSDTEDSFLDIGCGNGIIGKYLLELREWREATMIDDSFLATSSTELNLNHHSSAKVYAQYNLDSFEEGQFDLVITNPPFHFEYEVDPSIAIQLLHDAHRILTSNGRLIIVANRHLNYKSQLSNWYEKVNVISENEKFVIYEAQK